LDHGENLLVPGALFFDASPQSDLFGMNWLCLVNFLQLRRNLSLNERDTVLISSVLPLPNTFQMVLDTSTQTSNS
jgi:hypothetical protein